MKRNKQILFIILIFGLSATSCNTQTETDVTAAPEVGDSAAVVALSTPTTRLVESLTDLTFELKNCGTAEDLHHKLVEYAQVSTSIEISDEAIAPRSFQPLVLTPEMKAALEENIRLAHQDDLAAEIARVEETDFAVPANKITTFKVYWKLRTYTSEVSFVVKRTTYTVDYVYRINLPYITRLWEISCTA